MNNDSRCCSGDVEVSLLDMLLILFSNPLVSCWCTESGWVGGWCVCWLYRLKTSKGLECAAPSFLYAITFFIKIALIVSNSYVQLQFQRWTSQIISCDKWLTSLYACTGLLSILLWNIDSRILSRAYRNVCLHLILMLCYVCMSMLCTVLPLCCTVVSSQLFVQRRFQDMATPFNDIELW